MTENKVAHGLPDRDLRDWLKEQIKSRTEQLKEPGNLDWGEPAKLEAQIRAYESVINQLDSSGSR